MSAGCVLALQAMTSIPLAIPKLQTRHEIGRLQGLIASNEAVVAYEPLSESHKATLLQLHNTLPEMSWHITRTVLQTVTTFIDQETPMIAHIQKTGGGFLNRTILPSSRPVKLERTLYVDDQGEIIINAKKHLGKTIGQGSAKTVTMSVIVNPKDGLQHIFAMAVTHLYSPVRLSVALRDAEMGSLFNHENVVHYHKVLYYFSKAYRFTSKKSIQKQAIYMPFYNGGDLRYLANAYYDGNQSLSPQQINSIFRGILSGLSYIHKQGFIHRDIKLDNIFLAKRTNSAGQVEYIPYIGDFGFTIRSDDPNRVDRIAGSPEYLAPEILSFLQARDKLQDINPEQEFDQPEKDIWLKKISTKVDDFAAGLMLGYLVLGITPKVWNLRYIVLSEPTPGTVQHVAWKLTRTDPEERISSEEALDLMPVD